MIVMQWQENSFAGESFNLVSESVEYMIKMCPAALSTDCLVEL